MMHIQCEQGSPEWLEARRGIPTASQFDRIISPYTEKPLAGSGSYLIELLTEWALGSNLDENVSEWMQRGQAEEAHAIAYYELERGVTTVRPGVFLRDDRMAGASPDLLVGDDGLVELKVPAAKTHIGYLLERDPRKYRAQMQGQLWITGRAWVDFLSYHATLPPVLLHCDRDEPFIRTMAAIVEDFIGKLKDGRAQLVKLGVVPWKDPGFGEVSRG